MMTLPASKDAVSPSFLVHNPVYEIAKMRVMYFDTFFICNILGFSVYPRELHSYSTVYFQLLHMSNLNSLINYVIFVKFTDVRLRLKHLVGF